MNEKIQQELLQRLDAIAAKLGVTVEYLWRILVKQAQVEAVYSGLYIIAGLATAWVSVKGWRFVFKQLHSEKSDASDLWLGILPTALALFFFANGLKIFTQLLNPEFWAFQRLLEMIR